MTTSEREDYKMKKVKLTEDEMRIILLALNELRNQLIKEGRYTDALDDIMIKLYAH